MSNSLTVGASVVAVAYITGRDLRLEEAADDPWRPCKAFWLPNPEAKFPDPIDIFGGAAGIAKLSLLIFWELLESIMYGVVFLDAPYKLANDDCLNVPLGIPTGFLPIDALIWGATAYRWATAGAVNCGCWAETLIGFNPDFDVIALFTVKREVYVFITWSWVDWLSIFFKDLFLYVIIIFIYIL